MNLQLEQGVWNDTVRGTDRAVSSGATQYGNEAMREASFTLHSIFKNERVPSWWVREVRLPLFVGITNIQTQGVLGLFVS